MIDIKVEEEEERRAAEERREPGAVSVEENFLVLEAKMDGIREEMQAGFERMREEIRGETGGEDARLEVERLVLREVMLRNEVKVLQRNCKVLQRKLKEAEGTIKLLRRRKFRNKDLKEAAKEYCTDKQTAETKYGPISGWDVSEVTSMYSLFSADSDDVGEAGKQFNPDLSRWDVSNVTDMRAMFYEAESFYCNLSSWNVEKVTYMGCMFQGAEKFDKNTIKGWKLKGKNTGYMFGGFNDDEYGKGTKKL
ncbi:hypothetical protein TrST_g12180 [Triparma strigata]|uniref:BspA family leucine-rich repeat surface protein n=1 Tax=Triparma strigata TaxID=1606541 RepID=A0A9W6ZKK4_9STRA|nr:hypothetical protein TrST_g12180 [Triparma strigata]